MEGSEAKGPASASDTREAESVEVVKPLPDNAKPTNRKLRIYRWAGKDFTTLADVYEAVRNSAILVSGKTAPADDGTPPSSDVNAQSRQCGGGRSNG
jgi:hypothetical protein